MSYFIVRPNGDTNLANAQIFAAGTLPQDITLNAASWQVGRVEFAPTAITVSDPTQQSTATAGGQSTIAASNAAQPTGVSA